MMRRLHTRVSTLERQYAEEGEEHEWPVEVIFTEDAYRAVPPGTRVLHVEFGDVLWWEVIGEATP